MAGKVLHWQREDYEWMMRLCSAVSINVNNEEGLGAEISVTETLKV